jgi:hypothetical protein
VREWFHNNTRNLYTNGGIGGARGAVLKIKSKPKMLQSWQAYHALTYESIWKLHVDKEWEKYKAEWEVENPNEKPPKKRLQIMVEFMKGKFDNESEEMKARCEEYRLARKESSTLNESEEARNLGFQS